MTSNGEDNSIKIEQEPKEFLFFKEPKIIISEWYPFGPIQFESFANLVMRQDIQRKVFLSLRVKDHPQEAYFKTTKKLAQLLVGPPSSKSWNVIEFETIMEIGSKTQVERINALVMDYGSVLYSIELVKIGEEHTFFGSDRVARVIANLFDDISSLMTSLLSSYQLRAIKIIYPQYEKEGFEKSKIFLIATKETKAKVKDTQKFEEVNIEYMQLLGSRLKIIELNDLKIVEGELGIVAEGEYEKYLSGLIYYLQVLAIKRFLNDLYSRIWIMWDNVIYIREGIFKEEEEILTLLEELSKLHSDLNILRNIGLLFTHAVCRLKEKYDIIIRKRNVYTESIINKLRVIDLIESLENQVKELSNFIASLIDEIRSLQIVASSFLEEEHYQLRKIMTENIKKQASMQAALEVIEIVIIGVYGLEVGHLLANYLIYGPEAIQSEHFLMVIGTGIIFLLLGILIIHTIRERYLEKAEIIKEKNKKT
ncbi:MAG: hypothetical protein ACTSSP_09115 [Candidatus Asgardarchaeia archaeon]